MTSLKSGALTAKTAILVVGLLLCVMGSLLILITLLAPLLAVKIDTVGYVLVAFVLVVTGLAIIYDIYSEEKKQNLKTVKQKKLQ